MADIGGVSPGSPDGTKAKELYAEFCRNYEGNPGENLSETLKTWDQLSEFEQREWMIHAGELDEEARKPRWPGALIPPSEIGGE